MKKMKKFLILLLLVVGCQLSNKTPSDFNVNVEVLDNDVKQYPKNYGIETNEDVMSIQKGHRKLAKIQLVNSGNDNMILLSNCKYYFSVNHWKEKNFRKRLIRPDETYYGECGKISIIQDKGINIYISYNSEADSIFLDLFWKRDSLGKDELKFYKNAKDNLVYHSSKKIVRGYKLNSLYKLYEDCPIINDSISRKLTQ